MHTRAYVGQLLLCTLVLAAHFHNGCCHRLFFLAVFVKMHIIQCIYGNKKICRSPYTRINLYMHCVYIKTALTLHRMPPHDLILECIILKT